MVKNGRNQYTPAHVCRQLMQLYCERVSADGFAYSVDEIAYLVDIDPKTCRKLIRNLTVPLIEQALANKKL